MAQLSYVVSTETIRQGSTEQITAADRSLLRLHDLVDHELGALIGRNHLVYRSITGCRDVDDVIARIDRHIRRRHLFQKVLIDRDLSTLRLCPNAYSGLPRLRALSAKQFRHLAADGAHIVHTSQGAQRRREIEGLSEHELHARGFVYVAHHADQNDVLTFIDADLRWCFRARVAAIHINVGSG